jgi:hypothetical protein
MEPVRHLKLVPGQLKRLGAPIWQLLAAVAAMLCGAALIGPWMVGVVLMAGGALVAVDALLRDVPFQSNVGGHDNVIERWRRAP